MFLLDTDVISELRKVGDGKADANVAAWLSGVDAASPCLSAITVLELEPGVLRIERRDAVRWRPDKALRRRIVDQLEQEARPGPLIEQIL